MVCARADGAYVWDVQGSRYLDFCAGGGAVAQGHNHTRIAAAMVEQCLRLCLTSRIFRNDRLPPFLEKLCTLSGFERALLMNTGAEAVETALKAVRKWGYPAQGRARRPGGGHRLQRPCHGRTTAMAGCSDRRRRRGLRPAHPGLPDVPFGDLAAAKAAAGPGTCGILVEPVQGTAGVVVPPKGFLRGLRELCDSRRICSIADEVQSRARAAPASCSPSSTRASARTASPWARPFRAGSTR